MRVLRNVWFFVLVIVTTEDVWQTSSIVVEKAIKSLVKTMGNTFDKLIAVVNVTSQGKRTVKPGKFSVDKLSERLARTTRFESPNGTVGDEGARPRIQKGRVVLPCRIFSSNCTFCLSFCGCLLTFFYRFLFGRKALCLLQGNLQ